MREDKYAVFVDMDWVTLHPVIYDLAFALIFVCGERGDKIDGSDIWSLSQPFSFDLTSMKEFITAYTKVVGLLSGREARAVGDQLILTWIHCRLDGAKKVYPQERKRFLSRDLESPFIWLEENMGKLVSTLKR